jgi:hypothetical protein
MKIIGYYNLDGYRIEDNLDGEILYEAGNNPFDSTSVIDDGLPLEIIKGFCNQTGLEMTVDRGVEFVGAYFKEVTA